MEIPSGKVLTTSPAANLEYAVATLQAKRRKLGSRVIRHFSNEITNPCADMVYSMEGNTCIIAMVRLCTARRCWKSAMLHNDTASTGENL